MSLYVALKFLKTKIKQAITMVLLIAIGTAVFYFILNSTKHLEKVVLDNFIRDVSHLSYTGEFSENSPNDVREEILSLDKNILDVSFYNSIGVLYPKIENQTANSHIIKGVDFNNLNSIHNMNELLKDNFVGRVPENDYELLVSVAFSNRAFDKNDPNGNINKTLIFNINNIDYEFTVVGTFYGENVYLNTHILFTTLSTINDIYGKDVYHGIDINLIDPLSSNKISKTVNNYMENKYINLKANNWQEKYRLITNLVQLEKTSVFIIQLITLLAIAFSLSTIIMLNIRAKYSNLGVLKALGLKQKAIRNIFLYQFLIYSFVGIFLGINIGNIIAYYFKNNLFKMTGERILPINTNLFNIYSLISIVIISTVLLIASIIPFRQLKKLKIIEIIKSE